MVCFALDDAGKQHVRGHHFVVSPTQLSPSRELSVADCYPSAKTTQASGSMPLQQRMGHVARTTTALSPPPGLTWIIYEAPQQTRVTRFAQLAPPGVQLQPLRCA